MGLRVMKRVLTSLVVLSMVPLIALGAGASVAETTTGSVINGTITGIAPLLCLNSSPEISFDIPLSSVVQMVIDFPRVVVETPTRVYIGPYSAFSGIDEMVTVQHNDTKRSIPFAALRAIAFNGHSFQKIPRTWLDNGFLMLPAVLNISLPAAQEEPTVASRAPQASSSAQTWSELYHTATIPKKAETPWWLLLLITAGLGVVVYLSL